MDDSKLPIICRFFGHNVSDVKPDGYEYCETCNSHEYWDDKTSGFTDKWNEAGLLFRPIWWIKTKTSKLKKWFNELFQKNELPF